jgi:hypothetical protein
MNARIDVASLQFADVLGNAEHHAQTAIGAAVLLGSSAGEIDPIVRGVMVAIGLYEPDDREMVERNVDASTKLSTLPVGARLPRTPTLCRLLFACHIAEGVLEPRHIAGAR